MCNTSNDNLPDAGCNKLPTFVASSIAQWPLSKSPFTTGIVTINLRDSLEPRRRTGITLFPFERHSPHQGYRLFSSVWHISRSPSVQSWRFNLCPSCSGANCAKAPMSSQSATASRSVSSSPSPSSFRVFDSSGVSTVMGTALFALKMLEITVSYASLSPQNGRPSAEKSFIGTSCSATGMHPVRLLGAR